MENGSLRQYLERNGSIDKLLVVSVQWHLMERLADRTQIQGITNGLIHLHESKIVHGDLKSVRIAYIDQR